MAVVLGVDSEVTVHPQPTEMAPETSVPSLLISFASFTLAVSAVPSSTWSVIRMTDDPSTEASKSSIDVLEPAVRGIYCSLYLSLPSVFFPSLSP